MKLKNVLKSVTAILLVIVMLSAPVACAPADSGDTATTDATSTAGEAGTSTEDKAEAEDDLKILFMGNSHINVPMFYLQFKAICEQMGRSCQIDRLTCDGTLHEDWLTFMESLTANNPDMFKEYDTVIWLYYKTENPSENQLAVRKFFKDDIDIYAYYTTIEFEWDSILNCTEDINFVADYAATAIMEVLCDDSDLILYQDEFDHTTTLYGYYTAMVLYYSMFGEACFDTPFLAPLPEYADETDIPKARTAAMLTCSLTKEQLRDKEFLDDFVQKLRDGDPSISLTPELPSTPAPKVDDLIDPSADTPFDIDFVEIPEDGELNVYYLTDSFHDSSDSLLLQNFKDLCEKHNIPVKVKTYQKGFTNLHYPGYTFGEKTMYEYLLSLYERKNTIFDECDVVIMQETRGYPMAEAAKLVKELFPDNVRAYYFASKADIESNHFGEFDALLDAGITVIPFGHAATAYLAKEDALYLPGLITENEYTSVVLDDKGSALGAAVMFYTIFGDLGGSMEALIPNNADPDDVAPFAKAMETVFSMSEERLTDADAFHQLIKALRFN